MINQIDAGTVFKGASLKNSKLRILIIEDEEEIRNFVNRNKAEKLLLFYFGPLSGACFIGHQLNAVCKEIQIMENTSNTYFPSFLLK